MIGDRAPGHAVGATFHMYVIALACFVAIDALWLGVVAREFYPQRIGHLLATDVQWGAAVLFYLVFVAGIVTFVIAPALAAAAPCRALTRGAFFGLVTYATYDLTNQATLRDWPVLVTVVDLAWGAFLTATTSYVTYWVVSRRRVPRDRTTGAVT